MKVNHILLVEDDPMLIEILLEILTASNLKVITAASVSVALDKVERYGENIDTVISDYYLPDGNGLDMLRKIKERLPDVQAVCVSGKSNIGPHCPNILFLQKPFHPQALLALVNPQRVK